jgi:hypothetical protein
MQRDPIEQLMKNPDNAAKLYLIFQAVQIATTALLVIVTIFFILYFAGVI